MNARNLFDATLNILPKAVAPVRTQANVWTPIRDEYDARALEHGDVISVSLYGGEAIALVDSVRTVNFITYVRYEVIAWRDCGSQSIYTVNVSDTYEPAYYTAHYDDVRKVMHRSLRDEFIIGVLTGRIVSKGQVR